MSGGLFCPRCGTQNVAGARFCISCGGQMPMAAPPQVPVTPYPSIPAPYPTAPPVYQQPPAYVPAYPLGYNYAAAMAAQNRLREIDRTKTGLLLILIGILFTPLPYANFVGDILILIGAILVIIGRHVFGAIHSRNTVWSIIIFVVGIAVVIAGALDFAFAVASVAIATSVGNSGGSVNATAITQSLSSSFNILLVFAVVGAAIFGIAEVLFTYALQNQTGKRLLWAGYVASVAVSIIIFIIVSPLVANAASQSFVGGVYNSAPLANLQTQEYVLGLLNYIPAIIFAGAIYLAWSRVRSGEILKPAAQPMTQASPPMPPSMSPTPPPASPTP